MEPKQCCCRLLGMLLIVGGTALAQVDADPHLMDANGGTGDPKAYGAKRERAAGDEHSRNSSGERRETTSGREGTSSRGEMFNSSSSSSSSSGSERATGHEQGGGDIRQEKQGSGRAQEKTNAERTRREAPATNR